MLDELKPQEPTSTAQPQSQNSECDIPLQPSAQGPSGKPRFLIFIVLFLLLSAVVAGIVLGQKWAGPDSGLTATQPTTNLETKQTEGLSDELATRLAQQQQQLQEIQQAYSAVQQQQQAFSEQLLATTKQNDASPKQNDAVRHLAEVGDLLQMTQDQVKIARHPTLAMTLLDSANSRLAQLGAAPTVEPLRSAMEQYQAQLKALPQQDIAALLSQLDTLIQQLPTLTLARPTLQKAQSTAQNTGPAAVSAAAAAAVPATRTWQVRLQESLRGLSSLVVIRHHDSNTISLIRSQDSELLLTNMNMQLLKAQWAILNDNDDVLQQSVQTLLRWQNEYFSADAATSKNFIASLQALQKIKLKTPWPDFAPVLQAYQQVKIALPTQQPTQPPASTAPQKQG